MMRRRRVRHGYKAKLTVAVVAGIFFATSSLAGDIDDKIASAMSAGPDHLTGDAKLIDQDGTVLRDGSNGWTCIAGDGDHKPPICNDAVWMKWQDTVPKGKPFSTDVIGYSYMLAGSEVDLDDPAATDRNNGGNWIKEGPHLMILMPSPDLYNEVSRDAWNGGPYVVWPNTPMEFVVVPLGGRP